MKIRIQNIEDVAEDFRIKESERITEAKKRRKHEGKYGCKIKSVRIIRPRIKNEEFKRWKKMNDEKK